MRLVAIGGEPATGKTTLMLKYRKALSRPAYFKWGRLMVEQHVREKLLIFGNYQEEDTFAGTDKLSMAVQPDAVQFVSRAKHGVFGGYTFLFEGDRLFNSSFLGECSKYFHTMSVVVLVASPELLSMRHSQRGDTQGETFLKSRRTKVENILKNYPSAEVWQSAEQDALVDRLQNLIQPKESPCPFESISLCESEPTI